MKFHSMKFFRSQIRFSFREIKNITKNIVGSVRYLQGRAGIFMFHEVPEDTLQIYDDEDYIPYTEQQYSQGIMNARLSFPYTSIL